jgi:hypothetical protein
MLGQFEFSGFKKARRGEVRIDVTFEINSDGIVNVTARDQETGQQASTQITLSSGLSEEEIGKIIDEGRTERVRGGALPGSDAPARRAPVGAPAADEDPGEELELLPDSADLLDEPPDLGIDDEGEPIERAEGAEEEEADPNAATQPDLAPLAVDADPLSTAAQSAGGIEPPGSRDGIEVSDLDGSPDDELEVESDAESLFGRAGTDLDPPDGESER